MELLAGIYKYIIYSSMKRCKRRSGEDGTTRRKYNILVRPASRMQCYQPATNNKQATHPSFRMAPRCRGPVNPASQQLTNSRHVDENSPGTDGFLYRSESQISSPCLSNLTFSIDNRPRSRWRGIRNSRNGLAKLNSFIQC